MVILLAMPAFADVEAVQMRHSVVFVEVGLEGNAGYVPLLHGTGFFIGEEGKDPQHLITNYHVIAAFDQTGSGNAVNATASDLFGWWLTIEGLNPKNEQEMKALLSYFISNVWTKTAGEVEEAQLKVITRVYYDDTDYDEAYVVDKGDYTRDMAILGIAKPTDKRVPLKLSVPTQEMVGHDITIIGYPGSSESFMDSATGKGEDDSTVTGGKISRIGTEGGTVAQKVQYDASTNGGNSGGPVILNETGAAVALHAWGMKNVDANMNGGLNMEEVIKLLKKNDIPFDLLEYPAPEPEPEPQPEPETESITETSTTTTTSAHASGPKAGAIIAVAAVVIAGAAFFVINNNKKKEEERRRREEEEIRRREEEERKRKEEEAEKQRKAAASMPASDDSLYRIQCVRGVLGSKRVMIPRTGQVVMGRNPGCGILFPEDTKGVSGRHCAVFFDNGDVYVTDLGSSFGTFIEPGQRLAAQQSVRIPLGKKFWLGSENECFVIEKKQK